MKSRLRILEQPRWAFACVLLGLHMGSFGLIAARQNAIQLPGPGSGSPGFTRVAEQAGIRFTNRLSESRYTTNQIYLNGSGVAAGDLDGDNLPDLLFCGLDGPNALYRNLGDWRFEERGAEAGLALPGLDCTGAAFADLDGDSHLDVVMNTIGQGTHLFLNDGEGRFTRTAVVNSGRAGMSLAFADIDADGDLDFYVTNYRTETVRDDPHAKWRGEYVNGRPVVAAYNGRPVTEPDLVGRFTFGPTGQVMEHGEVDAFFRNDGTGKFTGIPFTSGNFLDENGRPIQSLPYDWGLSCMFRDLNGDLAPDLYVCNDFESPDRIWINNGQRIFRAVSNESVRHTSLFSMGVDVADVNRDGFDDFFVADMLSRTHAGRHLQTGTVPPYHHAPGEADSRPQYSQNTLFVGRPDHTWGEIAWFAGVPGSDWSWTPVFLDVDLDGYEDLLITTGHQLEMMNADVIRRTDELKASRQMSRAELLDLKNMFERMDIPNVAFRNHGNLHFSEAGEAWGFNESAVSHGMALADLDGDGDLDAAVNNLNSAASLYRNESPAPRIAVRLAGKAPNTAGIGAKIRLTGGPVPQSQEMIAGGRYLSGDQPLRVFAAGTNGGPYTIEVTWRDGTQTVVANARANHLYKVHQSDARRSPVKAAPRSTPLFEDGSPLLGHAHAEEFVDDLQRQPLLPMRLSQLGPGVAWHDFDGDSWADLILPTGRSGRLAIFRNTGQGGFTNLPLPMLQRPLHRDQTTPLALGQTLFVGSSNYEDGMTNGGAIRIYDLQRHAAGESLLGPESATGPMALADVDGDGALDLFIGGRAIAGRYPEPASSILYRNEGMNFVPAQRFEKLGLVSGAVFSDLEGDGDPDLVLACHWGPVRVFINDDGHFTEATEAWGLARHTGLWNGVATGDLNNDGRPDLIASNWGLNTRWQASPGNPLRLYYGDFDKNGVIDMIEATHDEQLGKEVPIRGLRVVGMALPWVQEKIGTYEAYGRASLREIYGARLDEAIPLEVTTLASMVFLNRGGRFEARPLPSEVQFSPAFAVCVGEMDGDGQEDVFLSQNFFATNLEMPRSDAGRGLWLRGDGRGNLAPVPGHESGVAIYGEQRGAALADYDHDGRTDLVVMQNAGASKLYRNQGATPGLRVTVQGPPGNPDAIGTAIRLLTPDGPGPLREIQAGSGYWSKNAATQVLGRPAGTRQIMVRLPRGDWVTNAIPAEARAIVLDAKGKLSAP